MADSYITSLDPGIHNICSHSAHAERTRSTWETVTTRHSSPTYEDSNWSCSQCAVAKSDGFIVLMREGADVVEQCQLMLKSNWLKTQWLNVIEHRNNIMNTLLESLHKITSMLCSQEHSLLATWIDSCGVLGWKLRKNHVVLRHRGQWCKQSNATKMLLWNTQSWCLPCTIHLHPTVSNGPSNKPRSSNAT